MSETIEWDLEDYDPDDELVMPEDVKPGWHTMAIKNVRGGLRTGNDDPKIVVSLRSADDSFRGRLDLHLVQTKNAAFRSAQFLRALGVEIEAKRYALDADNFIDREIEVEIGEPDGSNFVNVNRFRPAAGSVVGADEEEGEGGLFED